MYHNQFELSTRCKECVNRTKANDTEPACISVSWSHPISELLDQCPEVNAFLIDALVKVERELGIKRDLETGFILPYLDEPTYLEKGH